MKVRTSSERCTLKLGMLTLLWLLLAGCEHKDLFYQHPAVAVLNVAYDWTSAPDADPQAMGIWFYPSDGGTPVRADFKGRDGGSVTLRPGIYDIITYNTDYDDLNRRNSSGYNLHYLECYDASLFGHLAGLEFPSLVSQRTIGAPDPLWGCSAGRVEVTFEGDSAVCVPWAEKDEWADRGPIMVDGLTITLAPQPLTARYSVEIHGIPDVATVFALTASVGSLSPLLRLCDGARGAEEVTQPLPLTLHASGTAVGETLTFGRIPGSASASELLVYIWRSDDTCQYYRFDVTRQIETAPDPRRVHLVVACTDPPTTVDPGRPGQDSAPSVSDWFTENHNVPMM